MRRLSLLISATLVLAVTIGLSQTQNKNSGPVKKPEVSGDWAGDWGLYSPPIPGKTGEAPKPALPAIHFQMTCKVKESGEGKWEATFEGNAGRPYKFVIKMPGRQVGSVAMFSGTVDLGEKDGGVYDWIGRATDKEFVGFFTSQGYTGSFRLARPPAAP